MSEAVLYDELIEIDDCSDSDEFRDRSSSEVLEVILSPAEPDAGPTLLEAATPNTLRKM